MINNQTNKKFDLEQRTLDFSKAVIDLIKTLPKNSTNFAVIDQLIRSATSVGANYREANDALGKKDFYMRSKICRKEAKEAKYWLELTLHSNPDLKDKIEPLLEESTELIKIFSSIIGKVT